MNETSQLSIFRPYPPYFCIVWLDSFERRVLEKTTAFLQFFEGQTARFNQALRPVIRQHALCPEEPTRDVVSRFFKDIQGYSRLETENQFLWKALLPFWTDDFGFAFETVFQQAGLHWEVSLKN